MEEVDWYDDTKGVWSKVIQDSTIIATFGKDGIMTGSGGCNQYSIDITLARTPGYGSGGRQSKRHWARASPVS